MAQSRSRRIATSRGLPRGLFRHYRSRRSVYRAIHNPSDPSRCAPDVPINSVQLRYESLSSKSSRCNLRKRVHFREARSFLPAWLATRDTRDSLANRSFIPPPHLARECRRADDGRRALSTTNEKSRLHDAHDDGGWRRDDETFVRGFLQSRRGAAVINWICERRFSTGAASAQFQTCSNPRWILYRDT